MYLIRTFRSALCVGIAFVVALITMTTVNDAEDSSSIAVEKFRASTLGNDYAQIEEANESLFKSFTSIGDSEDYEFDSSLTVATAAHWYSICSQLCYRNEIEDFRELRSASISSFVGRLEGRLNVRVPDFWTKSLLSYQFRRASDDDDGDDDVPFRYYSNSTYEELSALDDEKYVHAEGASARVGHYAKRLGVQPDDGNLFFRSREQNPLNASISDFRIDAAETQAAGKYLLFYSVDNQPIYYIRHEKSGNEAMQKLYHRSADSGMFNLFEIHVKGSSVIVWGTTRWSCFFVVHDAHDLKVLSRFCTF